MKSALAQLAEEVIAAVNKAALGEASRERFERSQIDRPRFERPVVVQHRRPGNLLRVLAERRTGSKKGSQDESE